MARAYITAKPDNPVWIKSVRDNLCYVLEAESFYDKKEPHITVVPPFSIDDEDKENVITIAKNSELIGREVSVQGLAVYNHIHNPWVIMLDVEVDMQDERDRMMTDLEEYTNGSLTEPVNPHITLLKSEEGHDFPLKMRRRLQREIASKRTFRDITIGNVYVEFKD